MKQIHKEITEDEASARAVAGEDYDGGLSRHGRGVKSVYSVMTGRRHHEEDENKGYVDMGNGGNRCFGFARSSDESL